MSTTTLEGAWPCAVCENVIALPYWRGDGRAVCGSCIARGIRRHLAPEQWTAAHQFHLAFHDSCPLCQRRKWGPKDPAEAAHLRHYSYDPACGICRREGSRRPWVDA